MADTLTPSERSARMSRIRSQDTKPELLVRRVVHGMGYRYRLHRRDLPGNPDIVLPRHRAVIFVHGCFWHRHEDPCCRGARMLKSRLAYWQPKLEATQARDARNRRRLEELGRRVLVLWECGLRDRERLEATISAFLRDSEERLDDAPAQG